MIEIIPNWHPVFVHFTIALFSISTLFYLVSHITSNTELQSQWLVVAKWNLWIGAMITLVTVAAGWQAYYTVDHDGPSHVVMTDHRNWAMGTFIFFSLLAVWSVSLHRLNQVRNWLFVGLMIIASGVLLSTAWRGGEVVFRYGIGVMSLPKPGGEGHDHEHAEGGHGTTENKSAETIQEPSHDDGDHAPNNEDHHEVMMEKKPDEHKDDGHAH